MESSWKNCCLRLQQIKLGKTFLRPTRPLNDSSFIVDALASYHQASLLSTMAAATATQAKPFE